MLRWILYFFTGYKIMSLLQGARDKITILYDTFPSPLGHTKRKYSDLQDDLLTAIPPSVDEINKN